MASVPSDDVNAEVDKAAALLSWLAKVTNDPGIESRVALGTTRYGRGLVALRNLVPNEVIFNVPWRLVLAEDHDEADASDLPWSALMAARLLEERHANGERARWIESLPALVSTPPLGAKESTFRMFGISIVILPQIGVFTKKMFFFYSKLKTG